MKYAYVAIKLKKEENTDFYSPNSVEISTLCTRSTKKAVEVFGKRYLEQNGWPEEAVWVGTVKVSDIERVDLDSFSDWYTPAVCLLKALSREGLTTADVDYINISSKPCRSAHSLSFMSLHSYTQ